MKLVEVCADGECSHYGLENRKPFCLKERKEIKRTSQDHEEGIIPEWCPLPKEGQEGTAIQTRKDLGIELD